MNIAKKSLTAILIFVIRIYQVFLSPLFGCKCRFIPTCSEYSKDAFKYLGILLAIKKIVIRILKCHPFTKEKDYVFDPILPNINICNELKLDRKQ